MKKLNKKLAEIIKKGFKEGKKLELIKFEVLQEIKKYDFKADYQDSYDAIVEYINTLPPDEKYKANAIIAEFDISFARIKKGLQVDVGVNVISRLKKDVKMREIEKELQTVFDKRINHAKTIVRTAENAFSTYKKTQGGKIFTYAGPPAERYFCRRLLALAEAGRTWTKQEIEAMDNGQDLPVLLYGGGYNCRHEWLEVENYVKLTPEQEQEIGG